MTLSEEDREFIQTDRELDEFIEEREDAIFDRLQDAERDCVN